MERNIFSQDEVQAILKLALERKKTIGEFVTKDELLQIARELNIEPIYIEQAIENLNSQFEFEQAKKIWKKKRKSKFFEHLVTFVATNFAFFVFSLLVKISLFKVFLIVTAFWSIGLIIDFFKSFFPSEDEVEKGANKLIRSKKWKKIYNSFVDYLAETVKKINL